MERMPIASRVAAEDAELAALISADPEAGVALLYDRYGRAIYALALRLVDDRSAAEEIVQDTLLGCWNAIDSFDPARGTLLSWMLTIAHHRGVDELRRRRSRDDRSRSLDAQLDQDRCAPIAYDGADAGILAHDIQRALHDLPPLQREPIELLFWGGFSRPEIAARLGLPLGTVHTRMRLGMDKLRSALRSLWTDESPAELAVSTSTHQHTIDQP